MESHGVGVESFVSEGIIALYYKRIEDVRTHSIEILKMRGSEHSRKVHPFDITPNGILVHPEDVMYGEF
jgi:KaiC/GvpD/RAD55 family RecA-like ATPase